MLPSYDEITLTESAYRHGFDDQDVVEVVVRPCLVIVNRRGRSHGYEVFGQNATGAYLLLAAKLVEYDGWSVLRVYHVNWMTDSERRRFLRHVSR